MKALSIRSLVFTALFAALFIVMSLQQMKITSSVVPLTFQTLGVIMAGIFLKPKQAFISIFAVIILGAIGLPVFGGKGGISHILGATGGYIVAFPFCAMLISFIVGNWLSSNKNKSVVQVIVLYILFVLASIVFVYAIGVPWMMVAIDYSLQKALAAGCYPFIPGDLIKAAIGIGLLFALKPTIAKTRF